MRPESNVSRLPPVQYDIDGNWDSVIIPALSEDKGTLAETFCELKGMKAETYLQMWRDGDLGEGDEGAIEFIETIDILMSDKSLELKHLRDFYAPDELSKLAKSIAETLFPEKVWEVIEDWDGRCSVVTDSDRTMVFDFIYGQAISGIDSLALAEDKWALKNGGNPEAYNSILEAETDRLEKTVVRLKEHLAMVKSPPPSNVLPFSKNGD
jgi:hypothetical protein